VPAIASEPISAGAVTAASNGHERNAGGNDAPPKADAQPGRRPRWFPRWTLRLRLTLLYGALFLAAGAVLLGITYALVVHDTRTAVLSRERELVAPTRAGPMVRALLPTPPPKSAGTLLYSAQSASGADAMVQLRDYQGKVTATLRKLTAAQSAQLRGLAAKAKADLTAQRNAQLDSLLTKSGIALGIMALVSIGLGWVMAGRALRPVRTMGLRARGISERNLHERLALDGPNDELKELGHAFDGLLARLESAFESQRRFVANASHELRTPITVERTLVEVALADPDANAESLRATCERVLAASEQQERMIEALLTLARSQRGLDAREDLDLAAIAGGVLRGAATTGVQIESANGVQIASANGVRIESALAPARTTGDPALVERLVANLVDNALHYNVPSGWVRASTGLRDGRPTLTVTNSGTVIPPDRAAALIEPFRRLDGDRNGHSRGVGLGLSIVDAIATAHGAELTATPRDAGGLEVEVRFPTAR
jgi:signal transduction histidine kinase